MAGKNLTNQRFGRLLVIKDTGKRQNKKEKIWLCKCDCGNYTEVMTSNLTGNRIRSCGCLRREVSAQTGKDTAQKSRESNRKNYIDGTYILQLKSKSRVNNSSGHKGVYWDNTHKKWVAHLTLRGKKKSLGYYDNLTDAVEARKVGEEKYYKPILEKYEE